MSKTGTSRDTLTGFLRDADRRLNKLEHRRLVGGGKGGGGGSNIIVNPTPPTIGDGSEGDFWLDSDSGILYGPKQPDGSWPVAMLPNPDEVTIDTETPVEPNDFELWYDPDAAVAPAGLGFTFVQGVSSTEWVIDHPLDFVPNVTVVDSGGSQVEGEVEYTDADTITLRFSAPFAGTAYLS